MRQLVLPDPRTWGGARKGAGRKRGPRPRVLHRARPEHKPRYPVHVTMRRRRSDGVPSLRMGGRYAAMEDAIHLASGEAFRIVHFSVQRDHVHMIVEAHDRLALSRGMRGLAIRAAKGINRALARNGRVWGDRYHAQELTSPRQVRSAIAYVLLNRRKHDPLAPRGVDPRSSGAWFTGWARPSRCPDRPAPVARPRTWLLSIGWRRAGLVRDDERPGLRAPPRRRRSANHRG